MYYKKWLLLIFLFIGFLALKDEIPFSADEGVVYGAPLLEAGEFLLAGGSSCVIADLSPIVMGDDFVSFSDSGTSCGSDLYDSNMCTAVGDDGDDYIYALQIEKVGRYRIELSNPGVGWIDEASWFVTTSCPDAANSNGGYCVETAVGSPPSNVTGKWAYFQERGTYYLHISGDEFLGATCTTFDLEISYDDWLCNGGVMVEGDPLDICVGDDGDYQPYYYGRPAVFGSNNVSELRGEDLNTAGDAGFFLYVTPGCTLSPAFIDNSRSNAASTFSTDNWGLDTQSIVAGSGTSGDPYIVETVLSGDCDFGGPSLTMTNTTTYVDGTDYFTMGYDICFDNVADFNGAAPPIAYFAADFWEEAAADDGVGFYNLSLGAVGANHINGNDPSYPFGGPPIFAFPNGLPDTHSSWYQFLVPSSQLATSYQESSYNAVWTAIQNAPAVHPQANTVEGSVADCGADCTDHAGLLQYGTNNAGSDLVWDANGCTVVETNWCFGQGGDLMNPDLTNCPAVTTAVFLTRLGMDEPIKQANLLFFLGLALILALLTLGIVLKPKSQ